jgi:thymidylate kinase
VPVQVLAKRMGERRSVMEWPRIQLEVREVYLKLIKKGLLVPVDGNRPVEEVSREILSLVLERLKGKGRLRV